MMIAAFLLLSLYLPCAAPEDLVEVRGRDVPLRGTVLSGDERSLTLRISLRQVESIVRGIGREGEFGDRLLARGWREPLEVRVDAEDDRRVTISISRSLLRRVLRGDRPGAPLPHSRGGARGRILFRGNPLAEAEIRVVRVIEDLSAPDSFGAVREVEEFSGRTDGEGRFRLARLTPGLYRLYIRRGPSEPWRRRARPQADLPVVAGKTTVLRDIVISRVMP